MTKSTSETVFLDSNVLYPTQVKDFLLSLTQKGLLNPKWTDEEQDEWVRNLLPNKSHQKKPYWKQTVNHRNRPFPDPDVEK